MSHASIEYPAFKPAASQKPLSVSVPWNLVAEYWESMVKGSAQIQMMMK